MLNNNMFFYVKILQNIQSTRYTRFESAKAEILQLYEELESEPNTTIERSLVCGDNENIILSSTNITTMETMLSRLQVGLSYVL